MKIITKFVGSSVTVFGLIIFLVGGSTILLAKAEKSVEMSRIQTQKALDNVLVIEMSLMEQVATLKHYLFINQDPRNLAKYQKAMSRFIITLDELEILIVELEDITVIRHRHQRLVNLANDLTDFSSDLAHIQQDIRAINSFNRDIHLYLDSILKKTTKNQQISFQKAQKVRHISNQIQYSIVVLVLLIFVIHLKLIILPIFNSIEQLELGAIKIGKGDFKHRLNIKTGDEIEKLAQNFNQMASQLDQLYKNIDQKVDDLNKSNQKLEQEVINRQTAEARLKQTQSQLIQTEKMSSLGQMVAGIAHEINNPVGFIHGNLDYAIDYSQDLLHLIALYQQHYPQPVDEIQAELEELDIEFVSQDFTQLMNSMKIGTERIRDIVKSLRTFSRLDEADLKEVDIHEGIDSTLMILQHRLKPQANRPEIQITKQYGELPLIDCYSGQLNQVFMNIISNAIDALEEQDQAQPSQIKIQTQMNEQNHVKIKITDNGSGIPEKVQAKLFEPFFTTKPIGKGTGLGLSICYQIIVDRHQGKIECHSVPGKGTEFVITIPVQRCNQILAAAVA